MGKGKEKSARINNLVKAFDETVAAWPHYPRHKRDWPQVREEADEKGKKLKEIMESLMEEGWSVEKIRKRLPQYWEINRVSVDDILNNY